MNKIAQGVLAMGVFLAASSCTHGSAREHARITHLSEIPLHPGVNKVETMVPDGRAGMIVEGRQQDAAGHAGTVYLVMLPDEAGTGWNVVLPEGAATTLMADGATATLRFAHGWLDGTPEMLLFTATSAGAQGPAPYVIDTYRLATGRKTGAPSAFERVSETKSGVNYSTPDAAMAGEVGLQ